MCDLSHHSNWHCILSLEHLLGPLGFSTAMSSLHKLFPTKAETGSLLHFIVPQIHAHSKVLNILVGFSCFRILCLSLWMMCLVPKIFWKGTPSCLAFPTNSLKTERSFVTLFPWSFNRNNTLAPCEGTPVLTVKTLDVRSAIRDGGTVLFSDNLQAFSIIKPAVRSLGFCGGNKKQTRPQLISLVLGKCQVAFN